MPCSDCFALRQEFIAQKDFMSQWFDAFMKQFQSLEFQTLNLRQSMEGLTSEFRSEVSSKLQEFDVALYNQSAQIKSLQTCFKVVGNGPGGPSATCLVGMGEDIVGPEFQQASSSGKEIRYNKGRSRLYPDVPNEGLKERQERLRLARQKADRIPKECKICKKTFVSKNYLKMHELTHSVEMNFGSLQNSSTISKGRMHRLLQYESQRWPGFIFEFQYRAKGRDENTVYYQCKGCLKLRKANRNLPAPPNVTIVNDIIQTDPDNPTNPHYCNPVVANEARADKNEREVWTQKAAQYAQFYPRKKPFECHHCDSSFVQRGDFRKHLLIHSGLRPYKCTVCERRFNSTCNLAKHKRTHSNEKPFVCPEPGCSYRCISKSMLTTHSIVHSKERPFDCNICGGQFKRRSIFLKHQKTVRCWDKKHANNDLEDEETLSRWAPKNVNSESQNVEEEEEVQVDNEENGNDWSDPVS